MGCSIDSELLYVGLLAVVKDVCKSKKSFKTLPVKYNFLWTVSQVHCHTSFFLKN